MNTIPYPTITYKIDTPPETFPILIDNVERIPALPNYTPPIICHTDILPYTTSVYHINLPYPTPTYHSCYKCTLIYHTAPCRAQCSAPALPCNFWHNLQWKDVTELQLLFLDFIRGSN